VRRRSPPPPRWAAQPISTLLSTGTNSGRQSLYNLANQNNVAYEPVARKRLQNNQIYGSCY
jgi:hypothetical protein